MFNNQRNKEIAKKIYRSFDSLEDYLLSGISEKYKNLKKIIVSDCDGIISTNESFYDFDGKKMKAYGCYDKEMLRLLKKIGWEFVFVSADLSGYRVTESRVFDLKEKLEHKTEDERVEYIKQLKDEYDIVVYVGDSLTDIPSLLEADYSGTTNNAPDVVKDFCDYVSPLNGGYGGFADVIWNLHDGINEIYTI